MCSHVWHTVECAECIYNFSKIKTIRGLSKVEDQYSKGRKYFLVSYCEHCNEDGLIAIDFRVPKREISKSVLLNAALILREQEREQMLCEMNGSFQEIIQYVKAWLAF